PLDDGGAPITTYVASIPLGGGECVWSEGPLECTIPVGNSTYSVSVIAANGQASSPPSAPISVTVPVVPSAPQDVHALGASGQAKVMWSPPGSIGVPVSSYRVVASPGGQTCEWHSGPLTCTVTGLVDETPYTFTVTGFNDEGEGDTAAPSAEVVV